MGYTSNNIEDLFTTLINLIKENKISDVVLSNAKCIKSFNTFNSLNEMLNYINTTYCDSILIKKKGCKSFTEQIYFHQFKQFKLNEKSLIIKIIKPYEGPHAEYWNDLTVPQLCQIRF